MKEKAGDDEGDGLVTMKEKTGGKRRRKTEWRETGWKITERDAIGDL
jgi:hypothetical protein